MELAELEKSLKSSKPAPVYLVCGAESFLRAEAIKRIKAALPEAELSEIEELPDLSALLDDLRTPALFSARRLVIIEDAEKLIAEAAQSLAAYSQKPPSTVVLLLVAETIDTRRKGVKELLSHAAAVTCDAPKGYQLSSWCAVRAKQAGKPMDSTAAKLLVDLAGTNMGTLDGLISALATYCKDRPRITSREVAELVGGDHARKIWELIRAITARAPTDALRTLDRLNRDPDSPASVIIFSLAREFRSMLALRRMLDAGRPMQEIRGLLDKRQWLADRQMEAAKSRSQAQLRCDYRLLLDADMDVKSGAAQDRWVIESLVLRLCGLMDGSAHASV